MAHFLRGNIPTTGEELARWLSTNKASHWGLKVTTEATWFNSPSAGNCVHFQLKDQNSEDVNQRVVIRFWLDSEGTIGNPHDDGNIAIKSISVAPLSLGGVADNTPFWGFLGVTSTSGLLRWVTSAPSGQMNLGASTGKGLSGEMYAHLVGGWCQIHSTHMIWKNR